MKIVISLGGSLLTKGLHSITGWKEFARNEDERSEYSVSRMKDYIDTLQKIYKESEQLVVVVGGGKVCREYQAIAREFGASQDMDDYIGIKSTHFNASLVASALEEYAEVPNNEKELKAALKKKKLVVCGGMKPGQSTDAVAALAAEEIDADLLINASNIDGVYTSDPKKNKDAKKIPQLSYEEFKQILSKNAQLPGQYGLFDIRAANTIAKAKIKTIFIDGTDPEEIWRAAFGKHRGSVVEWR